MCTCIANLYVYMPNLYVYMPTKIQRLIPHHFRDHNV
jgi:hypothetical protein